MDQDEFQTQSSTRQQARRRRFSLVRATLMGGFGGLCLGWFGNEVAQIRWFETGNEPLPTNGWVEMPNGVDPTRLRVTASRDGRHRHTATPAHDGSFRILVQHGGVFDLHVSDWVGLPDPYPRHGSTPQPEPTHAIQGGFEGVAWGARNVRVPLTRAALVDAVVRVRAADGTPVSGARVHLQSQGDRVEQVTDAEGRARFERLPPRLWHATAGFPGDHTLALLTGWTDFVPSGNEVQLVIPQGVEVRVRLAEGVRANRLGGCEIPHMRHLYAALPWEPGPDGTMVLRVPSDLPTLTLTASQLDQFDGRTSTERPVAAGAVAVREGATLLLEPLAR